MIDCNVHHLVFNLQVICIASCQKTNLSVLMRRLSQLLPLKLFTDGFTWGFPSSSSARLCAAVQFLCLKQNYFFLTVSWSVIVSLCLSSLPSNKMGDTCCGCKQQQKEKKTTDVIHMVVIHSPAALHLSCPRSRRGVVVQTRLTSIHSHSG